MLRRARLYLESREAATREAGDVNAAGEPFAAGALVAVCTMAVLPPIRIAATQVAGETTLGMPEFKYRTRT